MNDDDIKALREAAGKATPGPWTAFDGNGGREHYVYALNARYEVSWAGNSPVKVAWLPWSPTDDRPTRDAAYIAAANPAAITALLDRLAAAEAERDLLRADAERYRWLVDRAREEPVRPEAFACEFAPDTRLRWSFPVLLSYSCIGTQYSVSEAIDAALAAKETK